MKKEKVAYPSVWHGLKPAEFRRYRSWVNREKPGICGTYVSMALLDYLFRTFYHTEIKKEVLLTGLRNPIEKGLPYRGTFPWDLARGINRALKGVPEFHASMGLVPDVGVIKELSRENPLPVAVGTTALLGSPYKNHWVLVYAYGWNEEGKLFFKAYDNHGTHIAVIPASQTFGYVYLKETKEETE